MRRVRYVARELRRLKIRASFFVDVLARVNTSHRADASQQSSKLLRGGRDQTDLLR